MSSISNPPIPYIGSLPQPLQPGHVIRIQGAVNHSAVCFSINLQCSSQRHDVALHLSPVLSPPPRLVRNSIQDGQWGPEESHGPPFPFLAGQNFEIIVLAEMDEYKIAVNGQHFAEFKHRLPVHSVSHLAIDGDVSVQSLIFESSHSSQHGSSDITMPIGFINPSAPSTEFGGRPSSPYGGLPYPTSGGNIGPQPSSNPYGGTSPSYPYGPTPVGGNPYPSSNPYGPPAGSPYGGSSPSHSYGPPPGSPYGGSSPSNPYGPPSGGNPYGPPPGGYPQQQGGYAYPSQPGPYPGTSVVYPGQEKNKSSSGSLGGLTALGTALAGGIGGAVMGGKHKKHGHHSLNPASLMAGAPMLAGGLLGSGGGQEKNKSSSGGLGGLTALGTALAGGIGGAVMGGKHKKHGHHSLNPASLMAGAPMLAGGLLGSGGHKSGGGGGGKIGGIPIGGAVAGGAAALAGAYMLSKSPIGKVMKPKKMKKLYKHKHKLKHGFGGFYSSSSSSSSEEE